MARVTDMYRKQHEELVDLCKRLASTLVESSLAKDGQPARTLLSELSGKLKLHLAMEDRSLYPQLLSSAKAATAGTAKRLVDSVGGLAGVYSDYTGRYPLPRDIQAKPGQFVKETRAIIAALSERIRKEEYELYVLADAELG